MNSIQFSQKPPQSTTRKSASTRRQLNPQRQPSHNPYGAIAAETTVKIIANLTISLVAVTALVQLIPSYKEQQQKLQEISQEVERTEARVQRLRSEFSHNFDPQQTQKIMQEQTELQDPQQLSIIWQKSSPSNREAPKQHSPKKPQNSLPSDPGATALVP